MNQSNNQPREEYPIRALRFGEFEIYVRKMRADEMPEDGVTYYCDVNGTIYSENEEDFELLAERPLPSTEESDEKYVHPSRAIDGEVWIRQIDHDALLARREGELREALMKRDKCLTHEPDVCKRCERRERLFASIPNQN